MLALIKNGQFVRQIPEDSRFEIDGNTVMPAMVGTLHDGYSLHKVHAADPVPAGYVVVSQDVKLVGDVWKFVNTLEEAPPPPSIDEMRAGFPELTSRQFWLAAFSLGITEDDLVSAAGDDEQLIIEIRKSTNFERLNDSVVMLAPLMGITPEQLDDVWLWAAGVSYDEHIS